jgi:hypothetical protein
MRFVDHLIMKKAYVIAKVTSTAASECECEPRKFFCSEWVLLIYIPWTQKKKPVFLARCTRTRCRKQRRRDPIHVSSCVRASKIKMNENENKGGALALLLLINY